MPGIDYTLGMKTSGFDSGVSGALKKLSDLGVKAAAITAAAGIAVGVGAGAIVAKGIEEAARIETLETAFAPLLKGSDAARDRIEELSRFAASTPFELPEIATASRTLETLTKGTLSTGDGLTLVGDVAAAVDKPFDELSVTIGRLYDSLQGGRAAGEPMARLQELGVISGDTRAELEALQAEGMKGPEVWSVAERAMSAFTGSMERQSTTWNGKLSTLRDTVSMTLAAFGAPIIDSLKPYLDTLTEKVEGVQNIAAVAGEKIASALDFAFAAGQTGMIAEVLGDGFVLAALKGINAFSSGIRSSLAYLEAALTSVMEASQASWNFQEITGIFVDLAKGIGSAITEGILAGIDAIPGVDRTDERLAQGQTTDNHFNRARNRVEDLNGGDAVQGFVDSLSAAHRAGKEAAAKVSDDPLFDVTEAQARMDATAAKVQAQIDRNAAERKARAEELDARLAAAVPDLGGASANLPDPGAAATTRSRPNVDRLAQIGGYVGNAAAANTARLAERTEQWTRQTAEGVRLLVKRQSSTGLPPATF